MTVPTPDELAAIAAAYVMAIRRAETPPATPVSRWSIAGRVPSRHEDMRLVPGDVPRWATAGRLRD